MAALWIAAANAFDARHGWRRSTEMNPLVGLLAPVLAVLPIAVTPGVLPDQQDVTVMVRAGAGAGAGLTVDGRPDSTAPGDEEFRSFRDMVDSLRGQRADQVRIEQRVIIRIAPSPIGRAPMPDPRRGPPDWRRNLFADLPTRGIGPRLEERRMAQCVPVSGIAGVQVTPQSKLVLFMRDQKIVSAALEKACNARDFYSGFYLERTADGMLCSGRDMLHSRSGANCALGKLRQLVEIGDDDE